MTEQKQTRKRRKKPVKASTVAKKTKNKTRDDETPPVWSHVQHLRCPGPSRKYPEFLNRVCGHLMNAKNTVYEKKYWQCPACGHNLVTEGDLV